MKKISLFIFALYQTLFSQLTHSIVTAEKLLEHKRKYGFLGEFHCPEIVLVCYQKSTLKYLLEKNPHFKPSEAVSHFYTDCNIKVGILGDWGVGAPGLAIKMEELIALGVKKFIAIGTAGGLMDQHSIGDQVICPKALAEDGVAHLYLSKNQKYAYANKEMISDWENFAKKREIPPFQSATAWSFSAIFKETRGDLLRVSQLGCSVVEMEAATLYAIGKEKNVQTLSLFVISDSLTQNEWTPKFKDPVVTDHLDQLSQWVLDFCLFQVSDGALLLK